MGGELAHRSGQNLLREAEARVQVDALEVLPQKHERLHRGLDRRVLDTAPEREHVVGDVAVVEHVLCSARMVRRVHDAAHRELDVLQKAAAEFGPQDHGVVERRADGAAHRVAVVLVVEEAVDERVEVLEVLGQVERAGERAKRVHVGVHHAIVEREEHVERREHALGVAAEPEEVLSLRGGDVGEAAVVDAADLGAHALAGGGVFALRFLRREDPRVLEAAAL